VQDSGFRDQGCIQGLGVGCYSKPTETECETLGKLSQDEPASG